MKFNKWTLGLAAVGAVSMASAVRADEAPKLVPLNTALSNTTISGYVDVGVQYNPGNYGSASGVAVGTFGTGTAGNKVDVFSLNDVDVAFDRPEDESPWAAGYHIDFNAGTDAVGLSLNGNASPAGTAGVAIRQAYIVMRTPVGNGIDWKIGIQDDVIGYEGNTDANNPNYTRSIGYFIEPTTLLGLVGSYKICDAVTIQAGLVNATAPLATFAGTLGAYRGSLTSSSDKTIVADIAFTAPDSLGFAKGATLNLGALLDFAKGGQDNYYAGLTLPTPISALKLGASFDLLSVNNAGVNQSTLPPSLNPKNDSGWVIGAYATFQATDKLSFNARGEYYDLEGSTISVYPTTNGRGEEVTFTAQYNLWANIMSRAEVRWDHVDSGTAFANNNANSDAFLIAANLIYTF